MVKYYTNQEIVSNVSAHFIGHFFAAQDVDMQVRNALHGVGAFIGYEAESAV